MPAPRGRPRKYFSDEERIAAVRAYKNKMYALTKGKPLTDRFKERNIEIIKFYRQGKTVTELAEMFNISKQRVNSILQTEGKVKPKNAKNLRVVIDSLMSLGDAVAWIDTRLKEFGLSATPKADTLKVAAREGRLVAFQKGGVWLTREKELRDYLKTYDPKNKTKSRPVKRPKKVNDGSERTEEF